ncbi:MAG: hypothetical protein J3Q66DRAFT_61192 [Benniella sp.]|nr:MAG: hypothetical protein J3Q66DRAFT_61192 [Benniella sp.]
MKRRVSIFLLLRMPPGDSDMLKTYSGNSVVIDPRELTSPTFRFGNNATMLWISLWTVWTRSRSVFLGRVCVTDLTRHLVLRPGFERSDYDPISIVLLQSRVQAPVLFPKRIGIVHR